MNLIEEINHCYTPVGAMVVYKKEAASYSNNEFYIEHHKIDGDGNMLSGAPLTEDAVKELGDYFFQQKTENEKITGIVPESLLHFKMRTNTLPDMVWYRPAQMMEMFFVDTLNIPNGSANVPALIFKVENGSLSVFAIKEDSRPNELTPLFLPPFHNCSKTGSVCLGSARVKHPTIKAWATLINLWEELFWKSKFSHLGDETTSTNINLFWKSQVLHPNNPFDLDILIDSKLTLKHIL
ncbi:hypothetical protein [Mucilaginibacter sp. UYCu711]|uniref:hypothetical protein n=1 Tax=Mucilaginibacter sp. UYCu711 TaxID=3156339 RepID=UPI003D245C92